MTFKSAVLSGIFAKPPVGAHRSARHVGGFAGALSLLKFGVTSLSNEECRDLDQRARRPPAGTAMHARARCGGGFSDPAQRES